MMPRRRGSVKTKSVITIGIIGCGHWGPNFVRNFSNIKNCRVKYASDVNAERLSHVQEAFPGLTATPDYHRMLKDEAVDAVVVATPAHTHYRIAKDSLRSGKHVLVEKPITVRIPEAKELIKIAARKKKILMVGHTFKFNPGIRKLKSLLDSGSLGKVYYIYSRRTNLGPIRKDVNAVWDLAPHDISVFNYLLHDTPLSVSAQGNKCLPHNLEDICFITLDFPKRVLGHIHVSWLDPKKVREIVVVGSKKMAIFDDLNARAPIALYDKSVMKERFRQDYASFKEFQMIIRDGKTVSPKVKNEEPLKLECAHFIDCIRNGRVPLTDGREGLQVLKVLIAIRDSLSRGGVRISLGGFP
jgi:predicted dehydrogenase